MMSLAGRGLNGVDQTYVLIGIPRDDLGPRQRLGFHQQNRFGSVHGSIFASEPAR